MPTVRDHMTRDLVVVRPGAPLREAASLMAERSVGAVLVVEGRELHGILTERDILRAVAAGYEENAPVADRMTRHPDTVGPDDSVAHAGTLMIHGGFRHLPVIERGTLVGIMSIRDVMRVTLADQAPRGV